MAETFQLDPAFEATSVALGSLGLCEARLQNDARWPWIVLIPRAPNAREIEDLHPLYRPRLMDDVVLAGEAVRAVGRTLGLAVEKLNVGALRLRLVATKDRPCADFPDKDEAGAYPGEVILDFDYWAAVPKR